MKRLHLALLAAAVAAPMPAGADTTVTLAPTHVGACTATSNPPLAQGGGWRIQYSCGGAYLQVGNRYVDVLYATGLSFQDVVSRLALLFDDAKFRGKTIVSAKLKLNVWQVWNASSYPNPLPAAQADTSCAARVASADAHWWGAKPTDVSVQWVDGSRKLDPGQSRAQGADRQVTIDVTSLVSDWAGGAENRGLVLESQDENLKPDYAASDADNGQKNNTCVTLYDANPTLIVDYHDASTSAGSGFTGATSAGPSCPQNATWDAAKQMCVPAKKLIYDQAPTQTPPR